MAYTIPTAEIDITPQLVKRLIEEQFPDYSALSLQFVGEGWDNVLYQLGDDFLIRLPRRVLAVPLLVNEQDWLPILSQRIDMTIPVPVGFGIPTSYYPWKWSIIPFIKGATANTAVPSLETVTDFAHFLKQLHQPAPSNAPKSKARGVPIQNRADFVEERMSHLAPISTVVTPSIEKIWKAALAAPLGQEVLWVHGDLHPKNIIVDNGNIVSIIDWGDLTAGDVASDLACIWLVFDTAEKRQKLIELYQPSADLLARAKGWAVFYGVLLTITGLNDNIEYAEMGQLTLKRLEEDEKNGNVEGHCHY